MAGLIDITEALCLRIATGDIEGARLLAKQAAAKMGAPRGTRVERAFTINGGLAATQIKGTAHWKEVREPRSPWCPSDVVALVDEWIREAEFAEELAIHGERVLPLLLAGETRCGKTSMLCGIAGRLGLGVMRLSLASVVGSHMGEGSGLLRAAFKEIRQAEGKALWLVDEIDGVSQTRHADGGGGAGREHTLSVATLLTEVEALPPGSLLAATTNVDTLIDAAVLGRFNVVRFPAWSRLQAAEQFAFSSSHGHMVDSPAGSYADAVRDARRARVARIIASAARPVKQLELGGAP